MCASRSGVSLGGRGAVRCGQSALGSTNEMHRGAGDSLALELDDRAVRTAGWRVGRVRAAMGATV